jgi:hypothetical protein
MSDITRLSICPLGDGRGKEKLWVQILHRLSIIKLNLFSNLASSRPYFFHSYKKCLIIETPAGLQALGNHASQLPIQPKSL